MSRNKNTTPFDIEVELGVTRRILNELTGITGRHREGKLLWYLLEHPTRARTAVAPPPMGTCVSARSVLERGSPGGGGGGDSQAAPAYGRGRDMKREATGSKALRHGGADEGEDLEAQAVRRALESGVQRWCLDVGEWGELSADQVG